MAVQLQPLEIRQSPPQALQPDESIAANNVGSNRPGNGLRLFVDLLMHVMTESGFLKLFRVQKISFTW